VKNPAEGFLTLGIETSCDDTAVAVLRNDREVLAELLSSQDHTPFGGVVPELAARRHLENILPSIDAALKSAGIAGRDLDLIAVTQGPGLMGSLMVGVETARALAQAWGVPLIGVNHLEGHMFAPLIDSALKPPFLSLIVSGGHTEIVRVYDFGRYAVLGATRDDAAGEAYDKAAKVMNLPYPGGPEIDKLARTGNPRAFDFPVPLKNTNRVEFSFSGLKTALLWQVNKLKEQKLKEQELSEQAKQTTSTGPLVPGEISLRECSLSEFSLPLADLCASFQHAVTQALIVKVALAVRQTGIADVAVSGGVAANSALRRALESGRHWKAHLPRPSRCTDNAVMIALAGYNGWHRGLRTPSDLAPDPSLEL
jgi:N6-L-threonylcarbamoyladenine synthase